MIAAMTMNMAASPSIYGTTGGGIVVTVVVTVEVTVTGGLGSM
jgi:hypothetical protein